MAHHSRHQSDDIDSEFQEMMEDLAGDAGEEGTADEIPEHLRERVQEAAEQKGFGATGEHPEGKLTEEDEGQIRFGVAEKDGKVVINFGKPVRWFAATPEQAKDLAGSLLNKAREAKRDR